jgi:hypothetical protein
MSLVEASLGVMSIQAVLASVVGALEGEMFVESSLVALSQSVSLWLGQDFQYYYLSRCAQSKLGIVMGRIQKQGEEVALLGSDPEQLSTLLISNSEIAHKLNDTLSSLCDEIKTGYTDLMESAESKVDLKSLNTKASAVLKSSSATLSELETRILQCENEIRDLKDRLDEIEGDIDGILGMIQSLTFVS